MKELRFPLAAAVLLATVAPAGAAEPPAAACHCYRDRSYDPARPAATDSYLLSAGRSSLLSAALGPSKREFIEAVMTGTSPDDLWVAHWAAAKTGTDASALLQAKAARGSWKAALAPPARLGKAFEEALARAAPDGELAALAVDDVLASRVGVEPATLAALQGGGATPGEKILAVMLAPRVKKSPGPVLAAVKRGETSWGALLQGLGLTPKDLDGLVRQAVSR